MTGAAAARGVLRPGDRVVFDGAEYTVVGLSGTSVRLAGAELSMDPKQGIARSI